MMVGYYANSEPEGGNVLGWWEIGCDIEDIPILVRLHLAWRVLFDRPYDAFIVEHKPDNPP